MSSLKKLKHVHATGSTIFIKAWFILNVISLEWVSVIPALHHHGHFQDVHICAHRILKG